MKLLYLTDLHGIEWKHNKIFEIASSLKPVYFNFLLFWTIANEIIPIAIKIK